MIQNTASDPGEIPCNYSGGKMQELPCNYTDRGMFFTASTASNVACRDPLLTERRDAGHGWQLPGGLPRSRK